VCVCFYSCLGLVTMGSGCLILNKDWLIDWLIDLSIDWLNCESSLSLESCIVLNEHNTVFTRSGPLYAAGVSLGPPKSSM